MSARVVDVEKGIPQDGLPALGDFIAADPDNETFIFRKFDRLGAQTLLMLQAQIFTLEKEADDIDRAMAYSHDINQRESLLRWETMVERSRDPQSLECRRLKVANHIKERLREYHETLMLQSSIVNLGKPNSRVVQYFRDWMSGKTRLQKRPVIAGRARTMLDDEDDLVALRVPTEPDILSRLIRDWWRAKGTPGARLNDSTRYFPLRHVTLTVGVISTVVAALQLIGSIVTLYFVTGPGARLGLLSAFSILFGVSLKCLTNAKRAEIYASSAAYAAVLVVFVSGNLGQVGD